MTNRFQHIKNQEATRHGLLYVYTPRTLYIPEGGQETLWSIVQVLHQVITPEMQKTGLHPTQWLDLAPITTRIFPLFGAGINQLSFLADSDRNLAGLPVSHGRKVGDDEFYSDPERLLIKVQPHTPYRDASTLNGAMLSLVAGRRIGRQRPVTHPAGQELSGIELPIQYGQAASPILTTAFTISRDVIGDRESVTLVLPELSGDEQWIGHYLSYEVVQLTSSENLL